jgi:hypothetical protein
MKITIKEKESTRDISVKYKDLEHGETIVRLRLYIDMERKKAKFQFVNGAGEPISMHTNDRLGYKDFDAVSLLFQTAHNEIKKLDN